MKHVNVWKMMCGMGMAAGLALTSVAAWAADGAPDVVRVNFIEPQTPVDVRLADGLQLVLTADTLKICNHDATQNYAITNVKGFSYVSLPPLSVAPVRSQLPCIELEAGCIAVSNCPAASKLAVFDMAGVPVICSHFDGSITRALDALAPGVYVIVVNDVRFKIVLR